MAAHQLAESLLRNHSSLREHLNSLKQQISDMTKELEERVSSGYFDILCSAQNLADLSHKLSDLPELKTPTLPEFTFEDGSETRVPKSPFEHVWGLVEGANIHNAVEELLKAEASDESDDLFEYLIIRLQKELPKATQEQADEIMKTLDLLIRARPELFSVHSPVQFYIESLLKHFSKVPYDAEGIVRNIQALQSAKAVYNQSVSSYGAEVVAFDSFTSSVKASLIEAAHDLLKTEPDASSLLSLYSMSSTDLWPDFKSLWLSVTSSMVLSSLDLVNWLSFSNAEQIEDALSANWKDLTQVLQVFKSESEETYETSLASLAERTRLKVNEVAETASSDLLLAMAVGVSSQSHLKFDLDVLSNRWVESTANRDVIDLLRQIRRVCGRLTHLVPQGLKFEVNSNQRAFSNLLKVKASKAASLSELEEAPLGSTVEGLLLPPRYFPHLVLN